MHYFVLNRTLSSRIRTSQIVKQSNWRVRLIQQNQTCEIQRNGKRTNKKQQQAAAPESQGKSEINLTVLNSS
ncbi:Uncharacterized protein TCM_000375 [Theobroma cacao]|uniref:Uncharacterized protein n=1 Tax=Theobroma cacao TaxID=3641 RepID=A0A061DFP4_THECC|nr:Uncharacterized protein TCM_000375 [Theobroma cacao]